MIDRESVVRRHCIELANADPSCALTVGNGDFAFTADITGMQTFPHFHDQVAAYAAGRPAVNTATMSSLTCCTCWNCCTARSTRRSTPRISQGATGTWPRVPPSSWGPSPKSATGAGTFRPP